MIGVKEGELALMSSVLLELASWLWLGQCVWAFAVC